MRKNTTLQMRQKLTLLCQVAFPVFLILFVGLMQVIIDNLMPKQPDHQLVEHHARTLNVRLHPTTTFEM
jgi:hypothetical protein